MTTRISIRVKPRGGAGDRARDAPRGGSAQTVERKIGLLSAGRGARAILRLLPRPCPLRSRRRPHCRTPAARGFAPCAAVCWSAQPLPLPGSPYAFEVRVGANLRHVARDLAAAGIVPGEWPLVALARLRGVDRTIKAGNYEIASGITLPRLLDRLTQGDALQAALTVIEGATFAELKRALRTDPAVTGPARLPEAELICASARRANAEGGSFPTRFRPAAPDAACSARAHG